VAEVESRLSNPLSGDNELLQLYMTALDTVLGARDVRRSFDEFGLSAGTLRMKMIHDAQRVLGTATREFTAYQNAVASELSARAVDHTMTTQESRWSVRRWLRALTGRLVSTDLGEVLRGDMPGPGGRSSFWGASLPGRSWGDLRCMTTAPG
jgi:hypothetical protein